MSKPIQYSDSEIRWLYDNHKMVISAYHQAFCQTFNRQVSQQNLKSLRYRKGWRTGRSGRFEKGNVPWIKGKKMPFGVNIAKTQFKKGERPSNAVPVGTEVLTTKDKYLKVKVKEPNVWEYKHHLVWKQHHGSIPDKHAVIFIDGDRNNVTIENLKCVHKGVLARLNKSHSSGPMRFKKETNPYRIAIAELDHKINQAIKN